jgi:hypothetical protein
MFFSVKFPSQLRLSLIEFYDLRSTLPLFLRQKRSGRDVQVQEFSIKDRRGDRMIRMYLDATNCGEHKASEKHTNFIAKE